MCYSAQIEASYKEYYRRFGAGISFSEYAAMVRELDCRYPPNIERDFADPQTAEEREIFELIQKRKGLQVSQAEQLLFEQRARLVAAERKLQVKETKAASESARIARKKIEWATERLSALRRMEPRASDSRVYPGWYCPVLVMEAGQPRVHLMRYQCRPAGKPAFYDTKYPGTYNARRDNLKKFWRAQYGRTHGLVLARAFYEHVKAPDGSNQILEFRPQGWDRDMLVVCLWSRWSAPGEEELLSFAAITDEPPEEVASAGHDRCIVPIREENVEAWLSPKGRGDAALDAILDDREHPYYEHRRAA
jgi:putative SOS response-associated peptidase YedK